MKYWCAKNGMRVIYLFALKVKLFGMYVTVKFFTKSIAICMCMCYVVYNQKNVNINDISRHFLNMI